MKRPDEKSHCPVNYALETFGDSWSFLIIRDIVFWGKKTYREFLSSEEAIATNVLAARLTALEQKGILIKKPHPSDGRKDIYELTEKGLDLIPILLEMSGWAARYDAATTAPMDLVNKIYSNREQMFAFIREKVKAGGSLFGGDVPVYQQKNRA